MQAINPPQMNDAGFVSSDSGLLIPRSYSNQSGTFIRDMQSVITMKGVNQGHTLPRDERTMMMRFMRKGSGLEDYFSEIIVDGTVANIGLSPVIAPIITAEVNRQVTEASTASVELTGRKSTVRRAREAISRFDDSPLGATDAIMQIVRNMRTYNRGQPIATVPITYDMGKWDSMGLQARPLKMSKGGGIDYFYLNVNWSQFGEPIPFLPSVFDLEPTGLKEFPYWYRATSGKTHHWVLLHHSQIIPLTPGKTSAHGIGTSSTWMCMKHIAEDVLDDDRRIELMVNALADGLLGIGPIYYSPSQVIKELKDTSRHAEIQGNTLAKGYTVLTSPTRPIQFSEYSLRKDSGIEWRERLEAKQDHIAHAFQVPLSAITTRGGVGYGSQADTVADVGSGGGVDALLNYITIALGSVYPRVRVAVKRKNDRAQRLNMNTLKTFSESVKNLNAIGEVISPAMTRAIIDREIIDLPSVDESIIHTTASNDEDASQENQVDDNANASSIQDNDLSMLFSVVKNMTPITPKGATDGIAEPLTDPEIVSTSEFDYYWEDEDYVGMLESPVYETESDVEEGNRGTWVWIAGAWLYLIASRNRRIDRDESIFIRDTMIGQRQPTIDALTDDLVSGVITLQTYSQSGWNTILENNTNNYRLGRGGRLAITDGDTAILKAMLDEDAQVWLEYMQRVANGRYSDKQIRNYSNNFINGSTPYYERANAESYGLPPLPQYPGDGQTQCSKGCKCHLDIMPLPGNGNFDVRWMLGIAEHCPDCIRLFREWGPLRIRNGIIL